MIQELLPQLEKIKKDMEELENSSHESHQLLFRQLKLSYFETLNQGWQNLSASDRVFLARQQERPNGRAFINALCTQFVELHGDRLGGDDPTIVGGIAMFQGLPVTVLALCKGNNMEEHLHYNFGMANPCGYRKIQRLALQAEKFGRPILTFIDTPGAYPGVEAEEQGQGEAIASCLALFSDLTVPVIATVTGEGGSGGALALAVANRVIMLENAIYSILSPEGFATILWKDSRRKEEAAEVMKLTAQDLLTLGVIDTIVPEGVGGLLANEPQVMHQLKDQIYQTLRELLKINGQGLAKERYERFRRQGVTQERMCNLK